jgi:hypothetical protein
MAYSTSILPNFPALSPPHPRLDPFASEIDYLADNLYWAHDSINRGVAMQKDLPDVPPTHINIIADSLDIFAADRTFSNKPSTDQVNVSSVQTRSTKNES